MGGKKYILVAFVVGMILLAGCDYYARLGIERPIIPEGANVSEEQIIREIEQPKAPANATAPEEPKKPEPPAAEAKEIPRKTVTEGEKVSFPNLKATDPDGDPITYTFTEPLNKRGEWQTKTGDAGEYKITITASDGKSTVSQEVIIAVQPKNRAPVIEISDIAAKEGDIITLSPNVTDHEGDEVSVTYSGWMKSATKRIAYDEAGIHEVIVTASDRTNTVSKTVKITVGDVNRAPLIAELADVAVKEGELVEVAAVAADPDGDKVTIRYSEPLDENGRWQTKTGDAGEYKITITASDGKLKDSKDFRIRVESLNKPPVFVSGADDVTVKEGETVRLSPVVEDPEKDSITVTYSGWMTSSEKATGYDDAGTYDVTITATDGKSTVSRTIKVTVQDMNRAPAFKPGSFA